MNKSFPPRPPFQKTFIAIAYDFLINILQQPSSERGEAKIINWRVLRGVWGVLFGASKSTPQKKLHYIFNDTACEHLPVGTIDGGNLSGGGEALGALEGYAQAIAV